MLVTVPETCRRILQKRFPGLQIPEERPIVPTTPDLDRTRTQTSTTCTDAQTTSTMRANQPTNPPPEANQSTGTPPQINQRATVLAPADQQATAPRLSNKRTASPQTNRRASVFLQTGQLFAPPRTSHRVTPRPPQIKRRATTPPPPPPPHPPPPRTSHRATATPRGSHRAAAPPQNRHQATATQRISHPASPPTRHWETAPARDSPCVAASPPPAPANTNLQTVPPPAQADHKPTHSSQFGLSTNLNAERMFITNCREELDDNVTTKAMELIMKAVPLLSIQPTSLSSLPEELRYSEEDRIFIHHVESQHHFVMSTSLGEAVWTFDSLNLTSSHMVERQVEAFYQPRDPNRPRRRVLHPTMDHTQVGSTDCRVYAIAYAVEVALGTDPGELPTISYQRHQMRRHLLEIFHTHRPTSPSATQSTNLRPQGPCSSLLPPPRNTRSLQNHRHPRSRTSRSLANPRSS